MLNNKNNPTVIMKHLPISMDEVCEAKGVSKKNLKRLSDKHLLYKQCKEDLKGCKYSTPKVYFKAVVSEITDKKQAKKSEAKGVSYEEFHRRMGKTKTVIAFRYKGGKEEVGIHEVAEV